MNNDQVHELLLQALETEIGGQRIYRTAIRCAQNNELREEWEKYLDETSHHEEVLRGVFAKADLDPEEETPGRRIVRHIGESLVAAMEMALETGDGIAAELVAGEMVVEAETKDHMNWELIGMAAKAATGALGKALQAAHDEVEDQEDEHLYHTRGWTRELWLQSLGIEAVLPPPEEEKEVKTAIGAARARNQREKMLG